MALTRKFLSALGIEEEKAEQIITAHVDTVDQIKAERDKFKEDAEKLPSIQKQLDELIERTQGEDPYKEKFENLQKEFDEYKTGVEAQATTAKKEAEFRKLLKDIGIPDRRIDAVIKVSDFGKIELDSEGHIKDGDQLKESLKTEWSDFITTTTVEGIRSANPTSTTGKTSMTKEEIRAISDPATRQKAMLDNPTLFGLPESN